MGIAYRKVHYKGGGKHASNPVTYVRFGDQIVFTGTAKGGRSTVNAAEEIVNLIAAKEGVNPNAVTFYDLQTHESYPHMRPGQFIFNELTCRVEAGLVVLVTDWLEGQCHSDVFRCFQGYISNDNLTAPMVNASQTQRKYHQVQCAQY